MHPVICADFQPAIFYLETETKTEDFERVLQLVPFRTNPPFPPFPSVQTPCSVFFHHGETKITEEIHGGIACVDTVRRAPEFTPKSRTASGGHALPSAYIPELNRRVPRGFWGEFRGSTRTLPSYGLRAFSVNSSELALPFTHKVRAATHSR